MRMRGIPGVAAYSPAAALAAAAGGLCLEERIAAVYDPAIVAQALDRKHHVAFFAIDGRLGPANCTCRAIEAIAESAFGVDKGSARMSIDSASLSLAFDPLRVAFAAIQRVLDGKLAALRLTLLPMRLLDMPLAATC
jgi:hypothetical protein